MSSCGCSASTSQPPTASPTAATPEPSTVILMLLGTGLLFLTRKRLLPGVRNT
ncbi:MAG: PEP-CTERM sorting domain-containing protein [Candidatus Acidiferrales bacterium]